MSEWVKTTIGKICRKVVTGGTPLSTRSEYFKDGSIPWLKTKEVNFNRITLTENYISNLGLLNSSAKLIPVNSVIIAMYGQGNTAGRVAINKIPLTTNQACCNLIVDENKADYEFIYYYLSNSYDELVLRKTGSAQPNLNTKLLKDFELIIPSLIEQQAIATILSSLDEKIDLLHRQNKTLEALVETLFRQWFFKQAEKNWDERSLSDIAYFLNGLACQNFPPINELDKLPVLKIKELKDGLSNNSDWVTSTVDEKYIIENGDVIFAWSASLMVKIWDGERCVLNQHLFKVTSLKYPKWFYYLWCKQHLEEFISISASHATTMGHIKRGDLDKAKVLVPPDTKLQCMTAIMQPIINKLTMNNRQTRMLEKLRANLLPKLMSGEVSVLI